MNALDGYFSLGALVAAKTTLLLLVGFALSFLARRTSASARHVLWALTFVFLLLIPGMAYVSFVQREVSIPIAVLSPEPRFAQVIPAPRATAASPRAPRVRNEPGPEPRAAGVSAASIPWWESSSRRSLRLCCCWRSLARPSTRERTSSADSSLAWQWRATS